MPTTSTSENSTLRGARTTVYLREAVKEINRLRDLSNELRAERDALAYANQKLKVRLSSLGASIEGLSGSVSEPVQQSEAVGSASPLNLAHMADMIKAQLDSLEEFSRKLEAENAMLRNAGVVSKLTPDAPSGGFIPEIIATSDEEPQPTLVSTEPAPMNNLVHIPLDKRENPLRLKKEIGPAEGASIFAVRRQHPVRKAGFIKNIFGQSSE